MTHYDVMYFRFFDPHVLLKQFGGGYFRTVQTIRTSATYKQLRPGSRSHGVLNQDQSTEEAFLPVHVVRSRGLSNGLKEMRQRETIAESWFLPSPQSDTSAGLPSSHVKPMRRTRHQKDPLSQDMLPFTSGHVFRDIRMSNMAQEAQDHIVGPMPLREFVKTFLPMRSTVDSNDQTYMHEQFDKMGKCTNETQMYLIFIEGVNRLCPNFPAFDSHTKMLQTFEGIEIKPDVCFMPAKDLAKLKEREDLAKRAEEESPKCWRILSSVEIMAEFKFKFSDDAFVSSEYGEEEGDEEEKEEEEEDDDDDEGTNEQSEINDDDNDDVNTEDHEDDDVEEELEDEDQTGITKTDNDMQESSFNVATYPDSARPGTFQSDIHKLTSQAYDTLGQITTYATAQKSAQFRTHIFSLLIFKTHGRILYWDCSGVVVTRLFRLKHPYFAKFLSRYNLARPEKRGHDTTVKPANQEETKNARLLFPNCLRFVKISLGSGKGSYIAARPLYMGTGSPFGRSTRGFDVCDASEISNANPKKVFLKDTWRVDSRPQEHTIYDTLHKAKVPFITSVIEAADITRQKTIVQKIGENETWTPIERPTGLRQFQHYRMVLKDIGSKLTTFKSTKELVSVLRDALEAHKVAYEEAKILHRDISVGNIMIGSNGRGLLIDWDLSKETNDLEVSAMERTGTWQFTAARLLKQPESGNSVIPVLADDLESFVLVLTWVAFRYTPIALNTAALTSFMQSVFDEAYKVEDTDQGGGNKAEYLASRVRLQDAKIRNDLLDSLLFEVTECVGVRYERHPTLSPIHRKNPTSLKGALEHHAQRVDALKTSKWMLETFQETLKSASWPTDDAAVLNLLDPSYPRPITRKRHSEVFGNVRPTKRIRMA